MRLLHLVRTMRQTTGMSEPARVPSVPAKAPRAERAKYRLPADAIPRDELAVLDKRAPVDGDAALAWLDGTGPDPWQSAGSR